MSNTKYKIGQRIIVTGPVSPHTWCRQVMEDIGKIGIIVNAQGCLRVDIPGSRNVGAEYGGEHYTWLLGSDQVRLLDPQLLFNFMYD